MADKLTKEQVGAAIVGHLTEYSKRVAYVVDDYRNMQDEQDMPNEGKMEFAAACMKDISALTDILTEFLKATMSAGKDHIESSPTQPTEADVIDLETYRANGGLLN